MRGKDFNTGLRGVLFEARHYERMGSAVWLYAWLVLRQTHQTGSTGWVLGGAPISYKEIEEETGFNVRTLERWMQTLRRYGYIETEGATGGLIVRITKAKKHAYVGRHLGIGSAAAPPLRSADGARKFAAGVRKNAEEDTHNCVPQRSEVAENAQVPRRIGSSSVEEFIETRRFGNRNKSQEQVSAQVQNEHQSPNDFQNQGQILNPSCSGEIQNQEPHCGSHRERDLFTDPDRDPRVRVRPPQARWSVLAEARLLQHRQRAERQEAVRRELLVGKGPEVPRR